MLASLLNTPVTELDWARWSFASASDIVEIQEAILAQKSIALPQYQLDPIPPGDRQLWLERNQSALSGINGALQLDGADVEFVNFDDPKDLQGWIYSVYQQHYSARAALRI
jgi:hypothetical protein